MYVVCILWSLERSGEGGRCLAGGLTGSCGCGNQGSYVNKTEDYSFLLPWLTVTRRDTHIFLLYIQALMPLELPE